MADKKISELDALTGANTADDDRLVIVDTSAGLTKNITMTEFKSALDTGSGFVRVTGDTMTGDLALSGADVTFGDNDKAIFGAGSDLQIYHDGSNSYISDQGTGNIILDADDSFQVKRGANTSAVFDTNAEVALYHNNAVKLATTSTGVDITGTLTSDSLTVDGEGIISSATTATNLSNPILQLTGSSYTANGVYGIGFNYNTDGSGTSPVFAGYQLTSGSGNTKGNLVFGTRDTTTAGDVPLIRQTIAPNGDISFYEDTGTTPKFFWDASAESLGVGHSSAPTSMLAVGGNTTSTIKPTVVVVDTTNGASISLRGQSPKIFMDSTAGGVPKILMDSKGIEFKDGTLDSEGSVAVKIDSSGNVGIGTSSPDQVLHVSSSSAIVGLLESTGSSAARLYFDNTGMTTAGDTQVWAQNNDLAFNTNNTEAMRIDSSGHLLVGTTSAPSAGGVGTGLVVHSGGSRFERRTSISTNNTAAAFYNPNGLVGTIKTNGSATSYNTSSDYRLKTDAQPMTGASARVQALNPVNFEWIADGTRVDGFLAHEAQTVVPEAVTGTKDAMRDEEYEVTPAVLDDDGNVVTEAVMGTRSVPDYQGIDQSKLVPLLTAALQEALTKIDAMETRLAALEAE